MRRTSYRGSELFATIAALTPAVQPTTPRAPDRTMLLYATRPADATKFQESEFHADTYLEQKTQQTS